MDQALIIQHWLVPVVREAGLEGADQLNIDSDTDLVAGWDTVTMRTGVSTHLAAALADAEPGLLTLRSDPVWDDLRHDSRFEGLLSEARDLRFSPTMRGRRGGGRNPGNNR